MRKVKIILRLYVFNIECPETINKQELYLIWGMQFLGEFDEDEFLEELQELRENDDLSSKEQNRKWAEFIENFIIATQRSCVVNAQLLY